MNAKSSHRCGQQEERLADGARHYRVGVADSTHGAEVGALRRLAFGQAIQFDWNDELNLQWSAVDDAATVLGLWSVDGQLLSTVRATVCADLGYAEAFLEYSLAHLHIATPMLILSRAATRPGAGRRGLNSLIRQAYVNAAAAASLNQAITVVYAESSRLRSMQAAGFELFELPVGWDSEAIARTRPLLASLPGHRFKSACAVMSSAMVGPTRDATVDALAIADGLRKQCAVLRVQADRPPSVTPLRESAA